MLKQTKTTLKELTAQYRAVLRRAFLVGAITVSMTGVASAAINVTSGTTDIEGDIITAMVNNAQTPYSDGSYTGKTWNAETHEYEDVADQTASVGDPGAVTSASTIGLDLTTGSTNLAAFAGGSYTISDPTDDASVTALYVNAGDYTYDKTAADGTVTTEHLAAGDLTAEALSTTGYNYAVTTAYRTAGDSSVNISEGTPTYAQYTFEDAGGHTYSLADFIEDDKLDLTELLDSHTALMDDTTALTNAGAALSAYGADTAAFDLVSGRYDTTNDEYMNAIGDAHDDQATVDQAIADYRNTVGQWNANTQTYNAYNNAVDDAATYNSSLAKVISTAVDDATYTQDEIDSVIGDTTAIAGLGDGTLAGAIDANNDAINNLATGAVQDNAAAIDKLNGASNVEGSVAYSVAQLENGAVKNNADAIAKLNGASNVEGSVAYAVAQEAQRVDGLLGTTHGLVSSANAVKTTTGKDYDGNLAVGTTVEDHLVALDNSIGDRRTLSGDYVTTGDVATNLQSLNDGLEGEVSARATADTNLQKNIDANRAKAAADDAQVLKQAMGYTDKLEENMSAGVASAVALSSVAVSNVKRGEMSVGGGYGYYNSQSALALGAALGLSDNWSVNAGAGLGMKGSDNFSLRAGTNYKFKLF